MVPVLEELHRLEVRVVLQVRKIVRARRRNVRLAEAPSFGKPILLYDVQSVGAKSYLSVADELIKRTDALAKAAAGKGAK